MNKKLKIAIIVIAVLIVLVIAYNKLKSKPASDPNAPLNPIPGTNPIATTPSGNDNWPLQIGSKGDKVKDVQNAINRIYPQANLKPDGSFGQQTYSALITFVGTRYYPVTQQNYIDLLRKSTN